MISLLLALFVSQAEPTVAPEGEASPPAAEVSATPEPSAPAPEINEPSEAPAPLVRWKPVTARQLPQYQEAEAERLYVAKCSVCHGRKGDGAGNARQINPPPRNFVRGTFKFRSTPSGQLPTPEDLFATLTRGAPGTAMPSFSALSEADRWQLVQRVRRFSPSFESSPPELTLELGPAPAEDPQAIARGRDIWGRMGCAQCHGDQGHGDGPSAADQVDDLGRPLRPASLRRRENLRSGARPEDVFRAIVTGNDGTPMPSYAEAASEAELWDLTRYVLSLSER